MDYCAAGGCILVLFLTFSTIKLFVFIYIMSSTLRHKASNISLINPNNVITPLYNDGDNDVPIPFTYDRTNGVFDMDFSSGFDQTVSIQTNSSIYIRGSSFGAIHLVTGIGPNIKTWCENRISADAGTVALYSAPVVVKANILMPSLDPNSVDCFRSGLDTPPNFNSASGSVSNGYYSTYLFRTPLVLSYLESGSPKYVIFNTQYEGNT